MSVHKFGRIPNDIKSLGVSLSYIERNFVKKESIEQLTEEIERLKTLHLDIY